MSLSSKIKTAVMAVTLVVVGAGATLVPQAVYAEDCDGFSDCAKKGMAAADPDGGNGKGLDTTVKDIINVVLYVVGILAVVMVIIGGVKYTTSGGDSGAVTSAKNTILYGIIGLVIAILAYAIVNFVVSKL